jgi:hypothetical protein
MGAQYRGLATQVGVAILGDDSPVGELCAPMREAFGVLWRRAQQAGRVRPDVTSDDFLAIVASLPRDPETGRARPGHLAVVLDGVRAPRIPEFSSDATCLKID